MGPSTSTRADPELPAASRDLLHLFSGCDELGAAKEGTYFTNPLLVLSGPVVMCCYKSEVLTGLVQVPLVARILEATHHID